MIKIDLSSANGNQEKSKLIALRLSPMESEMIKNLLDKLNIRSTSKLIRTLIRSAYEQNIK